MNKQRESRETKDRNETDLPVEQSDSTEPEDESFRFEDRRHWVREEDGSESSAPPGPRAPSLIDEYRVRAEAAEQKLQDYIEAFKQFRQEQDDFRGRLNRDVDRRVELKFGSLVHELLEALDNLDLALEHVSDVPEAAPLAEGVGLARKRFLEVLERNGVTQVSPEGAFDPNEAEAVRVDPVSDRELAGAITAVLRPGYRLGDRVIRPARVAVGRHEP